MTGIRNNKWKYLIKWGHCVMCSEIIGECQSGHAPQKYENGCLIMDGAENRRGMHTYERIFEGGGCAYEVFQLDITADCNSYDKCRTEQCQLLQKRHHGRHGCDNYAENNAINL